MEYEKQEITQPKAQVDLEQTEVFPVTSQPSESNPPPEQEGNIPPYETQGNLPSASQLPPGYIPLATDGAQGNPGLAGLQYLTQIDQLFVKQKVEVFEAFVGWESNNKYSIQNKFGQTIFMAREENNCCTLNCCCGSLRNFDMAICDLAGTEVIHIKRPLNCQGCCFPCCLQTLEVQSPPGTVVGTVEEEWTLFKPRFRVKDQAGETVLIIQGPFWMCSCSCGDVKFSVLSPEKDVSQVERNKDGYPVIGKISKKWSGLAEEYFTDSDNFGVSFPLELDVNVKATLLGAVILLDFMFYETSGTD